MQANAIPAEAQRCIDECLDCYQTCFTTAMARCLPGAGKPTPGAHLGLMLNCAELCRTTAEFMVSGSTLHPRVCAACAEVCAACADACEGTGDMDECARTCRRCAESCRAMAASAGSAQGFSGSQQQNSDAPVKMPT